MPAGRYLFIPFLRTKSQKRQTKNRSSEKSHKKKTDRTNIIAKLRLRAIKKRKIAQTSISYSTFKEVRKYNAVFCSLYHSFKYIEKQKRISKQNRI